MLMWMLMLMTQNIRLPQIKNACQRETVHATFANWRVEKPLAEMDDVQRPPARF